jgi:hypothetical protein
MDGERRALAMSMDNYPPGTFAGDPRAPWNDVEPEPEPRWCDDCQWHMQMLKRNKTVAHTCCAPAAVRAMQERYGGAIDLIELSDTDASGCDEYEPEGA